MLWETKKENIPPNDNEGYQEADVGGWQDNNICYFCGEEVPLPSSSSSSSSSSVGPLGQVSGYASRTKLSTEDLLYVPSSAFVCEQCDQKHHHPLSRSSQQAEDMMVMTSKNNNNNNTCCPRTPPTKCSTLLVGLRPTTTATTSNTYTENESDDDDDDIEMEDEEEKTPIMDVPSLLLNNNQMMQAQETKGLVEEFLGQENRIMKQEIARLTTRTEKHENDILVLQTKFRDYEHQVADLVQSVAMLVQHVSTPLVEHPPTTSMAPPTTIASTTSSTLSQGGDQEDEDERQDDVSTLVGEPPCNNNSQQRSDSAIRHAWFVNNYQQQQGLLIQKWYQDLTKLLWKIIVGIMRLMLAGATFGLLLMLTWFDALYEQTMKELSTKNNKKQQHLSATPEPEVLLPEGGPTQPAENKQASIASDEARDGKDYETCNSKAEQDQKAASISTEQDSKEH